MPDIVEEWATLDDEIDFTNKTVLKINLLGDEIACDNITDAYKKSKRNIIYVRPPSYLQTLKTIIIVN